MGLRAQAAADFKTIAEDTDDFGWPITVTDPDANTANLVGFTTDTGQAVVGRIATVVLSIKSLTDASLGIPSGVHDETQKPWVLQFDDTAGTTHTFKVAEAHPDRTLGVVRCRLELYRT